jgi:hypothetical protein
MVCNKRGCFFCYEIARVKGTQNPNSVIDNSADTTVHNATQLIDTATGIKYVSINEAAKQLGFKVSTLRNWVLNISVNKSTLVLAEIKGYNSFKNKKGNQYKVAFKSSAQAEY